MSLRIRDLAQSSTEAEDHTLNAKEDSYVSSSKAESTSGSTSCAICNASFAGVVEQREHTKSDFHRYNLKLRLRGLPSLDESAFNTLIGDLDESLSGSETSGSASEVDENERAQDFALTTLLRRQATISHYHEGEDAHSKQRREGPVASPLVWFSSSKLPENTSLGIYRALLTETERGEDVVEVIKRKQLKPIQAKHSGSGGSTIPQTLGAQNPQYFLCMIGGGHFAAMIVSLAPEIRKKPGGELERHTVVKAHKTFHRYTTRRKQGGSQSKNDNAKGSAHSAGASIRRYNEMALEADVRGILLEWSAMIGQSELLFIRATGITSRKTLYGPYEGQVLRANDTRIRGFPFSTRRATQAELMRSFTELTRLKVSTVLRSPQTAAGAEHQKIRTPNVPRPLSREPTPKLSEEEETALMHTSQTQALVRRTKAPALLSYLTNNNLSPNFFFFPPSSPQHHHAPSLLHLASSNNAAALVLALLIKAKADPTVPNADGKTAFDIAGDTKTRDAFRIARHSLGEAAFDWKAAHVPSALSEKESVDRQEKERLHETIAEAERRKAELEKLRQEEEAQNIGRIERRAGTGQYLGNRDKTGADVREEEGRGLTPEMRMKLERERRARAAEERIKTMQGRR